jgi:hypothetical protein
MMSTQTTDELGYLNPEDEPTTALSFASDEEAGEYFRAQDAEALRREALEGALAWGIALVAPHDDLIPVKEAAARLGYIKTNGKIRETFYKHQAPRFGEKRGGRWFLSRWRFDAQLQEGAP